MSWQMIGVTPVSWKGPSMDAHALNIATEILTLGSHGVHVDPIGESLWP